MNDLIFFSVIEYPDIFTYILKNLILYKDKNFVILSKMMRFNNRTAKYTIALFIILGISGLLYTSSFLQYGITQNKTGNTTAGSKQKDIGNMQQLQSLTKGNQQLLANSSSVSDDSLTKLSKESSTSKPNMTKETGQSQDGGQNQSASSQSGGQNQSASSQAGGQNQSAKSGGPLDQLGKMLGLTGGKK